MGAGKADPGVACACPCKAVEDCFLAAHHIGCCAVALGNAGEYADVPPAMFDAYRAVPNCRQVAWGVQIRRLVPSLSRAGHAADQHWHIARHRHCGKAAVEFRSEPVPVELPHASLRAMFGTDMAGSVHRPQA